MTQLELALDYAPQRLRDHGLRDAHTFPLVSPDTGKVRVSYRQPAAVAWEFPRLEMRAGNTWPCITVDCDGSRSLGKLREVVLDEDLPTPNVIVRRVASGNCHAHFMLATPVHRGAAARLKPLQALGRAAEWLTAQLEGDRGYAGVLTLNPEWPGQSSRQPTCVRGRMRWPSCWNTCRACCHGDRAQFDAVQVGGEGSAPAAIRRDNPLPRRS